MADEYMKDENIYELNPSNFDKVIHKSNYTSIVKFYAPWCGYCQKIKPVYRKLGKYLHEDGQYAVNVAAVNCDNPSNRALCSEYRISGFPTIMVFRPPKYSGKKPKTNQKHVAETYNGERSLKAITSHVASRVKNYVKSFPNLKSERFKTWLKSDEDISKVVLIAKSQSVSLLYKTLAIDFLGSMKFGMISGVTSSDMMNVEGKDVEIKEEDLPQLFVYQSGTFIRYEKPDKLNKAHITEWLIKVTGNQPQEGTLSKKDKKFYSKYRKDKRGKKTSPHDEL